MERFVAGDVVVAAFPYSDLRKFKHRPVLILAVGDFGDFIVCQITSYRDDSLNTVQVEASSFLEGGLPVRSYIRPDKLFTADQKLIVRRAGKLKNKTINEVKKQLAKVLGL